MTDHETAVRVAALVVTYFPDHGLVDRLTTLLSQVNRLVIVDNGSTEWSLQPLDPLLQRAGVSILRNTSNLGIAAALNRGMLTLGQEGFQWVLTLDQDSEVAPGFISALTTSLNNDSDPTRVALIGANRLDKGIDEAHRWLRPRRSFPWFERVPCKRLTPEGTTHVITSGALASVAAFGALGPFLESLFIDLVDVEYCLRARRAGYRILVSCDARLLHQVGSKRRHRIMGLSLGPTHHVPVRRYYLFRNSVTLLREHAGAQPHWMLYHLLALVEVVGGILFFERDKGAKLRAAAVGIWHGLRKRGGPAPASLGAAKPTAQPEHP